MVGAAVLFCATAQDRAGRPSDISPEIAAGLDLQQKGRLAQAIAHYQALIRKNPRSAEAHNWLGVAYLERNALREAIVEFRKAIALQPGYARAHNNLGSTLAQMGNIAEGAQALQEGVRRNPDDPTLRANLGLALRNKGDAEGALEQFRWLESRQPESAELQIQIGQTLRQKGDLAGAVAAFESALALNPEARDAYYGLAQTLKQEVAAAKRGAAKQAVPAALDALRRGLEQSRAGDVRNGVANLRRAAELDPSLVEARYNLGVALWHTGDREQAVKELDEALRLDPLSGPAYAFRAHTLRETGDWNGARRLLQRSMAVTPTLVAAYFDLGVVLLRLGRMPEAIGQFEAGLNLPEQTGPAPDLATAIAELQKVAGTRAEAHLALGRLIGMAGGDPRQVIAAFQEAIRLQPQSPEAHNNLGLVHMQVGDDAKAIASFREALKLRPDYADAHGNLGAILVASNPAEAVRELQRAIAIDPASVKAQFNLATAYGVSQDPGAGGKEIAQLRKVISLDAAHKRAHFALGKALLRKGTVEEAVAELRKAVDLDPEYGEARYQLGLALARAGKSAEAKTEIEKGRTTIAESQKTLSAGLDLSEAKAALDRGEIDQAIGKFEAVIRQRPDARDAYSLLGAALARKGESDFQATAEPYIREAKWKEVEPLLRAYLADRANSWWGWYALGFSLFQQQRIGESVDALAKSLQLNVRNPEAHRVLGLDLMLIGRFDAAQVEFEQAAKLNPTSAETYFHLGRLHSAQDNYAPAKAAFEKAIGIEPNYVEALDGLGFALEAMGDDEGAVANYRKAAALNDGRKGNFVLPLVNLAAYHNRVGEHVAAAEHARKAIELNPRSDRAWFQLGRAQERNGKLDEAADALQRAVAINARVSSYHYVLGSIYKRLGKTAESQQEMETFGRLERESRELEEKRRTGGSTR